MTTDHFIHFLNQLEEKKIVSAAANRKIQHFLDFNFGQLGKLFLVLCGLIGAAFASAGIFAIISHNWDDFPKHLRGFLSLIPLLVGLYFYYKAVFEKKTPVWIESASLFLFMMIGATIALISSTYQLNGDFDLFIQVWLLLTIPLFYLGKASGLTIFYFGLMVYFAFPIIHFGFFGIPMDFDNNEKIYWFWIFFFAFLPHFVLRLNTQSGKQSLRSVYLSWLVAVLFYLTLPFVFTGGWLFWGVSLVLGYFLIDQKYFNQHGSILARPFKFVAYFALFTTLVNLTNKLALKQLFKLDDIQRFENFDTLKIVFWILGLFTAIAISWLTFKTMRGKNWHLNLISVFSFLVLLLLLIYYVEDVWDFDMGWLGRLVLNFYILFFGLSAMFKGLNEKSVLPMFYGLFMICGLLWYRYVDLDISFWLKGLIFIAVGGGFFLINYIYSEELEIEAETNPPSEEENEIV